MKIVIIGGSGLIGKKLGKNLLALGHEVLSASPSSGVDAVTGKGLTEALKGAQVVVDVANTATFDEKTAVDFFEKTNQNLSKAENDAGVKHHVALSIVGTERLANSGYFRAKYIQEQLVKASGIPYTIVRATQFFEFLNAIAQSAVIGQEVHLPPVFFQPMAADDVASILADAAVKPAHNNAIEIAGPVRELFPDFIQNYLKGIQDKRKVIADDKATYFGMAVGENSLVPENAFRLGPTTLESWIKKQKAD